MRQGKRLFRPGPGGPGGRIGRMIVAPSVFMGALGDGLNTELVGVRQAIGVSPVAGTLERLHVHADGLQEDQAFELTLHVGKQGVLFTIGESSQSLQGGIPVSAGDVISIDAALPAGVSLAFGGVLVMARSACAEYKEDGNA